VISKKKTFDKIFSPIKVMQLILIFLYAILSFIIVFQSQVQKNALVFKFINAMIDAQDDQNNGNAKDSL
jgi:hypothetical protein